MSEYTTGAQTYKIMDVEDLSDTALISTNCVLIPPDEIPKSFHVVFKTNLANRAEVECKN